MDLGGRDNGRDNTAEQVPLPALPVSQDASGTDVGESCRYPGRVRRKPSKFRDFEMEDSG